MFKMVYSISQVKIGILKREENPQRRFEWIWSGRVTNDAIAFDFVAVWADNADACSVQYAGTGALKTDFTRYVPSL